MNAVSKLALLLVRLGRIALTNPQRLSHVLGSTLVVSEEVVDKSLDIRRLPEVQAEDLLPDTAGPTHATLALFPKSNASVSVLEFVSLIMLLKRTAAQKIFEFGTYKGVSVTQLVLNAAPQGQVYTLDLPDQATEATYETMHAKDAVIAREAGKASLVPSDLRKQITFLRQDSALFLETPYLEQMDFVFVDGAHNFDYVRNDSEKGWRMLRPGGIIAWHDCVVYDPDVVRYLLQCPYRPTRIAGTSLAFALKPPR